MTNLDLGVLSFLNQILASTHALQFWDKNDFIAKLLSMVVARIAPNHLLQSHTNFFGFLTDLFHWLLLTKDYMKDRDVRLSDGDHPLDLLSHPSLLPTHAHSRSPVIPLVLSYLHINSSIIADRCTSDWLPRSTTFLVEVPSLVHQLILSVSRSNFNWPILGPASGRVWKYKTVADNILHPCLDLNETAINPDE